MPLAPLPIFADGHARAVAVAPMGGPLPFEAADVARDADGLKPRAGAAHMSN